jgi:hypothetical protein
MLCFVDFVVKYHFCRSEVPTHLHVVDPECQAFVTRTPTSDQDRLGSECCRRCALSLRGFRRLFALLPVHQSSLH